MKNGVKKHKHKQNKKQNTPNDVELRYKKHSSEFHLYYDTEGRKKSKLKFKNKTEQTDTC